MLEQQRVCRGQKRNKKGRLGPMVPLSTSAQVELVIGVDENHFLSRITCTSGRGRCNAHPCWSTCNAYNALGLCLLLGTNLAPQPMLTSVHILPTENVKVRFCLEVSPLFVFSLSLKTHTRPELPSLSKYTHTDINIGHTGACKAELSLNPMGLLATSGSLLV